jgi:hypothetical protein
LDGSELEAAARMAAKCPPGFTGPNCEDGNVKDDTTHFASFFFQNIIVFLMSWEFVFGQNLFSSQMAKNGRKVYKIKYKI